MYKISFRYKVYSGDQIYLKGKLSELSDTCPDYFNADFDINYIKSHLDFDYASYDIEYVLKVWNHDRKKVYGPLDKKKVLTSNTLCAVDAISSFVADLEATQAICRKLWGVTQ